MPDRQAFEALKYALRQSKDGIVVSFVIHPDEVQPELMALPIGSRLMIGWSEIRDDEKELASRTAPLAGNNGQAKLANEPGNRDTAGISKPTRRPFHALPLAQQAALRCEHTQFRHFLKLNTVENVIDWVRNYCDINSRSELGKGNHDADNKWRRLETEFQNWLTEQRYADTIR
jgi:hypothetical protein